MSLAERLAAHRIVVVCGSGGVGKTTIAASVGMALAESGRRTIVLAVDPARRLATSLGMPRSPGDRATVRLDGVSMETALLDTKRTFDELVERQAGSSERRDRIYANRFYRRIADTLSGTHEYMAMERLYELATAEDWEAIVVDTPPTRSALSFLDAPKRMTDFLGGQMFRWLLWPYRQAGRTGLRGASFGARALSRAIGRIAGAELLTDTAEFLAAFDGMYEGFKRRAQSVLALLSEEQTGFAVVAAPEPGSLREAGHFVDRLAEGRMHLTGLVVNRWRRAPAIEADGAALDALAAGTAGERAVGACLVHAARLRHVEAGQRAALDAFERTRPELPVTVVPELDSDVHDPEGLRLVVEHLRA